MNNIIEKNHIISKEEIKEFGLEEELPEYGLSVEEIKEINDIKEKRKKKKIKF